MQNYLQKKRKKEGENYLRKHWMINYTTMHTKNSCGKENKLNLAKNIHQNKTYFPVP